MRALRGTLPSKMKSLLIYVCKKMGEDEMIELNISFLEVFFIRLFYSFIDRCISLLFWGKQIFAEFEL